MRVPTAQLSDLRLKNATGDFALFETHDEADGGAQANRHSRSSRVVRAVQSFVAQLFERDWWA
jgi:hypothetical protein